MPLTKIIGSGEAETESLIPGETTTRSHPMQKRWQRKTSSPLAKYIVPPHPSQSPSSQEEHSASTWEKRQLAPTQKIWTPMSSPWASVDPNLPSQRLTHVVSNYQEYFSNCSPPLNTVCALVRNKAFHIGHPVSIVSAMPPDQGIISHGALRESEKAESYNCSEKETRCVRSTKDDFLGYMKRYSGLIIELSGFQWDFSRIEIAKMSNRVIYFNTWIGMCHLTQV